MYFKLFKILTNMCSPFKSCVENINMKAFTNKSTFDVVFSSLWILLVKVVYSQAITVTAIKQPIDASQTLNKHILG